MDAPERLWHCHIRDIFTALIYPGSRSYTGIKRATWQTNKGHNRYHHFFGVWCYRLRTYFSRHHFKLSDYHYYHFWTVFTLVDTHIGTLQHRDFYCMDCFMVWWCDGLLILLGCLCCFKVSCEDCKYTILIHFNLTQFLTHFNPSPAIPAHFFSYKCKRDLKFDLILHKCYTSFDPVKCLFFCVYSQ